MVNEDFNLPLFHALCRAVKINLRISYLVLHYFQQGAFLPLREVNCDYSLMQSMSRMLYRQVLIFHIVSILIFVLFSMTTIYKTCFSMSIKIHNVIH